MVCVESFFSDLRYALRMMRRAPLVTAIAVLSLALGIGANTAIFSVLDALLLKLLPVKDPRQIVMLSWLPKNMLAKKSDRARPDDSFSFPTLERLRQRFSVAGFSEIDERNMIVGGHAEIARGEVVSGNYYAVLGVTPAAGRLLTDDDDHESAAPACVISYRYWESRFGRDPSIIGQKIVLGGAPFTLVGVEPKGFFGLIPGYEPAFKIPIQLWAPVTPYYGIKAALLDPDSDFVRIAARIPVTARAQASAELNVLFHQLSAHDQQDRVMLLGPGGEGLNWIRDGFREPLLVLMAAVALVLLIACANVANLLLARAHAREKEISMRLALGAGSGRLVRQFLTESLLLAAFGGTLGVLLAYRAGDVLARSFEHLTLDAGPDARVLAFTAGVTILTAILFGLAPAIRATRVDVQPGLQRDARSSRSGIAHALVVTQLALSLVAIVGAGLLMRTLYNLRAIDLGMDIRNVTVFRLAPTSSGYTKEQDVDFAQRVLARLEQMPGVESASLSRPGGTDVQTPSGLHHASVNAVTAHFFGTMGIPVVLGRGIEERDSAGAPQVAVVNETLARALFAHESPVGRHFQARNEDYEIGGVVRDNWYNGIRPSIPPAFFVSYPQTSGNYIVFAVEVRTVGDPTAMAAAIRRAVSEVDSNVPIFEMKTEQQAVDGLLNRERVFAGLSAIFGTLALLLAAIGLYGVRAYAVARRTAEIGIRMALGADRHRILQMILRETGWLALFGVAIGLGAAYAATRYVQSMLYGIAPSDFTTFAGAAVVLIAVAALAGYLPARRAARVDPMVALRHD
jgi:predicted permease